MYDISVILCTRNRASRLNKTLSSFPKLLIASAPLAIELIIINDHSEDETTQVIDTFIRAWPSLNIVTVLADGNGISAGRNTGLRISNGRILMLTDDDVELADDYFTTLMQRYAQDGAPVMRGGRVLLGNPRDQPFTTKTETEPLSYPGRYPGGFIFGCNMAFSRSVYEKIGPMDERFGAGGLFFSAEDSDYLHRAHRAGIAVRFCPELVAYHFHGRREMAQVRALFRAYSIGDGALFAKHWNHGLLHCLVANVVKGLFSPNRTCKEMDGAYLKDVARWNLQGFFSYWKAVCLGTVKKSGDRSLGAKATQSNGEIM
jgi:GT2 family glycosyltransferase